MKTYSNISNPAKCSKLQIGISMPSAQHKIRRRIVMKKVNVLKAFAALLTVGMLASCSSAAPAPASSAAASSEAPSAAASSQAASSAAGGDIVIAGIYKMGDATWFIEEGKASEEVCKKNGATQFMYMDAKQDAGTYMELVDNCIAQKVSGVLVCLPDQNLSQATVDKLTAANIPVIAVDDPLQKEDGTLIAPWVGIDGYNIGVSVGEWGAKYIQDNKLADDKSFGIMLLTADTVSSCVPRTNGELDAIKKALPNFPQDRVFRADHDTSSEQGNTAASTVITGNPQIKKWLVLTVSDEGGVGASRALEQAGLAKDSCVVGLGAYLAPDEFAKEGSPFKAAAYFSAKGVGGTAAQELMDYIKNGTKIPEKYAVSAQIVTPKDDLKTIMPEYVK